MGKLRQEYELTFRKETRFLLTQFNDARHWWFYSIPSLNVAEGYNKTISILLSTTFQFGDELNNKHYKLVVNTGVHCDGKLLKVR